MVEEPVGPCDDVEADAAWDEVMGVFFFRTAFAMAYEFELGVV